MDKQLPDQPDLPKKLKKIPWKTVVAKQSICLNLLIITNDAIVLLLLRHLLYILTSDRVLCIMIADQKSFLTFFQLFASFWLEKGGK